MDLKALSDDELSEHSNAVLNEQERRARLARTAAQVAEMTARFVADGGDRATILEAVAAAEPVAEGDALTTAVEG